MENEENLIKFDNVNMEKLLSKQRQEITDKRRNELLSVIKRVGFRNARKSIKAWAKHYEVHERTIYRDFDWIKGNYKPMDLREVRMEIDIGLARMFEEALDLMDQAKTLDEKRDALNSLAKSLQTLREELEGWGLKEKTITNQINITKNQSMQVVMANNINEALNKARERWNSLKKTQN